MTKHKEFVVEHPSGDCYRVVTSGDVIDAIRAARRASRDMRCNPSEWNLISWIDEVEVEESVHKMDGYEKQSLLNWLGFAERSYASIVAAVLANEPKPAA